MESRAEERRRQRAERRKLSEKVLVHRWSDKTPDSPPQHNTVAARLCASAPQPAAGDEWEEKARQREARRLERQKAEEEEAARRRKEREAQRAKLRAQQEEEERQRAIELEERRRRRQDKLQEGEKKQQNEPNEKVTLEAKEQEQAVRQEKKEAVFATVENVIGELERISQTGRDPLIKRESLANLQNLVADIPLLTSFPKQPPQEESNHSNHITNQTNPSNQNSNQTISKMVNISIKTEEAPFPDESKSDTQGARKGLSKKELLFFGSRVSRKQGLAAIAQAKQEADSGEKISPRANGKPTEEAATNSKGGKVNLRKSKDNSSARKAIWNRRTTLAAGRNISHEFAAAMGGWSGSTSPSITSTTERPLKSVPLPRTTRLTRNELFNKSDKPNIEILKKHLFEEGRLELDLALEILKKGKEMLASEPNVLQVSAPVVVCGDIHGQYYDLLNLVEAAGDPRTTRYLFLGDYVDRGCFSTEVCFFLLCCKMCYPANVLLLRGNHECRQLAEYFNFKAECKAKYGEEVYEPFMQLFDALPLAAIVKGKSCGPFLCLHGGLSPFIKTVQDINNINRFTEPPEQGAFCDLLWSDPLVEQYELNMREHRTVTFLTNRTRGCGYLYGWRAVVDFLETNSLVSIIRAHEVQQHGYAEHLFKQEPREIDGHKYPYVITVFSAPNYCDMYQNQSAFLHIDDSGYQFKQLGSVPHPAYLPNFMNGLTYSLPFIAEQLSKFCFTMLQKVEEDDEIASLHSSENSHAEHIRQKVQAVRKIMVLMKKIREEHEAMMPRVDTPTDKQSKFDRNLSTFEKALRLDRNNECRPKADKLYRTL